MLMPAEMRRNGQLSFFDPECVRILVLPGSELVANRALVKIRRSTPMSALKSYYYERLELPSGELRFDFEGRSVADDDTPFSLGITDDDVINLLRDNPETSS